MRLPVEGPISISTIAPTLPDHGQLQTSLDPVTAAGHTRSYQRARRRSYAERGITQGNSSFWEDAHAPFDAFSYHVIQHCHRMFNHAQQLRFFLKGDPGHDRMLSYQVQKGMVPPEMGDRIRRMIEDDGCERYSQIGGWLNRAGYNARGAAYMPCYAYALNRIFEMQLGYAICRVDNGAAYFLEKMGARAQGDTMISDYYGGEVCLMSFRPPDLNPRFAGLVDTAVERLCESSTLYLGSPQPGDLSADQWWRTESIPIGGAARAS